MGKLKTKKPARKKMVIDSWKPGRREIYLYHNGIRTISVDPLVVYEKISEHPELDTELKILTLQSAMAQAGKAEAFSNVVKVVRDCFAVEPFHEENGKARGLTNQECLELLAHFFSFMADLKKKAEPLPSTPPPGEPADSGSHIPSESVSSFTAGQQSNISPPGSPSA